MRLYVGNLPFKITEAELSDLFSQCGVVDSVRIITDRDTGRSRGFAFVEMTNADEAERAIAALNGANLGGRALNVNEARPKTAGGGGGGGRGFGGGGGGGRGAGGSGGGGGFGNRSRREPRW